MIKKKTKSFELLLDSNKMEILMKTYTKNSTAIINKWLRLAGAMLIIALLAPASAVPQSPAPVNLRTAGNFAILAGSGVNNIGTLTHIYGDVGSFPTATINGLIPGNVTGILYSTADTLVTLAKVDLDSAYNDAQGRSLNAISLPGQLGGLTLAPGLYVNSSSTGISGTGPNAILTLDAAGDANAVWIFKMGSTLVTDAGTSIVLAGSAKAGNIFWQVGTSATLGTNSTFYGNIMAEASITLTTGVNLYGRALTRIAMVSLDANTVTIPLVTSVENGLAPQVFALFQNYPNPFNPSTRIQYSLEKTGQVSLKVYNVLGLEVAVLVNGRQQAGSYSVSFNMNKGKAGLSSGVYFYRLETESFVSTKKMILMK